MSTDGQATADFDDYRYVPVRHALFIEADRTLVNRFCIFHEQHPEVFGLFVHYTLELWRAGRRRGSGWLVAQRLRWDYFLDNDEEFLLNNDFIALYTRLTMYYYPQFNRFFELRRMKTYRTATCRETL